MSKLFKAKKLRRMLSLVFAFTLVFTLAMSAAAGSEYGMCIGYYPYGPVPDDFNYYAAGEMTIYTFEAPDPSWLIESVTSSVRVFENNVHMDDSGDTFYFEITVETDDGENFYSQSTENDGFAFGDPMSVTYSYTESDYVLSATTYFECHNEMTGEPIVIPSITIHAYEAL